MQTDGCNSRRDAPGTRHSVRAAVTILALVIAVGLMTACSTQSTAVTTTPTPSLAAGQVGIFLNSQTLVQSTASTQVTGGISAVRATDGKLIWSKSTNGSVASLASGAGALYAAVVSQTSTAPIHTSLLALRLRDGTQLWQQAVDTAKVPLAADDSALYIFAAVPGTQQIQIQALSASDGHTLWTVALQGSPPGGQGGAVLDSGTLYVPVFIKQPSGTQFQLLALRASDGTTRWSTPPGGQLSALAVSNGTVYTETLEMPDPTSHTPPAASILAWRADDGTQLWKYALDAQTEPGGPSSIAVSGGALYVAHNSVPEGPGAGPSGQLIALDAKTGSPLWHVDAGGIVQGLSAGASAIYAATIVYNPLVRSSPPTTTVSAYNPSDGKSLWTHPVSNGMPQGLFAATSTGIYLPVISKTTGPQATSAFDALSVTDGSLQWTYALDGFLVGWLAATAQ